MDLTARDLMSPAPLVVVGETSLAQCARAMRKHGFRHLPLVSPFGRLLGMVTDTDVFAHGALLGTDDWISFVSGPIAATAMAVARPVGLVAAADEPLSVFLGRWCADGADAVVVVDADQVPIGVVTEHDVLQLTSLFPACECPLSSPLTIAAGSAAQLAERTMSELHARHLVVERDERPVGVVTLSEVLVRLGKGPHVPIGRPARRLVTGKPGMSVAEIAGVLLDERIGCLPILDGGLYGVATRRHVLEAMATELAMEVPTPRAQMQPWV
jgi:CBS domain-containing protein